MPAFPVAVGRTAFGPLTWAFLFLHAVWLPYVVWRGRARTANVTRYPSRVSYSLRVVLTQAFLAAIALAVARVHDLRLLERGAPAPLDVTLGLGLLAVLIAIAYPMWRDAVIARRPRLYFVMPCTPLEKLLWLARAAAAGIGEEITYRGVLAALLAGLTGSWWLATVLQAAIFALAHLYQDRRSVTLIFALSIALQLLVLRSGSLWVAMGVHAVYDAVAGFVYASLGRRHGYPVDGAVASPGSPTPA